MKNNLGIIALLFLLVIDFSCTKNDKVDAPAPSSLIVEAQPSTDNSGNVSFKASANNAFSFEFDYGNGVYATVPTGLVTYKYPTSGTYNVKVTAKNASGQSISKTIDVTVNVALALVWADEFDSQGTPAPAKWSFDIGAGGWGNNELQYYTNRLDNAIVSDGTLKIHIKAESFGGSAYTSARILSRDKFSFKYGRMEVRAKLPEGGGTWPAIWMLGGNISSVGWPACGEIDVMEHKGNEQNKIYGTVHYPGHSGGGSVGSTLMITNSATAFHVYAVEWNASSIKFFVDNQLFHTVVNNTILPFNQNFFIILNVAMGGTFGGSVSPSFTHAAMEVDYVRVYQ
ncbi:MAG TPA: family 16 glycosylhydrolase [Niabella sp.]|nr:family 16 glycosylhydrolase [Niabella sp.]HOZ98496.1 family 16 glycosylhydrolase [Niabella sp.]HQW15993.1 family 16 glycosylhydrolase [Niabella sp.]HQX21255.1 family 16 glycosylhydrolase [Niabella sp.]HQX42063.1 family 16 glycosylhydrolase [Niabella sp.]